MTIAGESPEDRAARIARIKNRRGRVRPGTRREMPGDARLAAQLRARGEDVKEIAHTLDFSYRRALQLLKRQDVQALIHTFRQQHKVQTVERATDMTPRIFRRMGQTIDDPSPEAVGQVKDLAKTVLDLERVAASASGELKTGSTTIQVANLMAQQTIGPDPKQQLTDLLAALDAGHA